MLIEPTELALRLGASIVFGAALGFERSRHDHPAGLRTHALVSLAAALFMLISIHALHVDRPLHPGVTISYDPSRIASYVVAGIGFIGGGSIARVGLNVKGLTTAASLWLVTAVGLAAGAGLYVASMAGAGLGLVVLAGFRLIEHKPRPKVVRRARVDLDAGVAVGAALGHLADHGFVPESFDVDRRIDLGRTILWLTIELKGASESLPLLGVLERVPGVRRVSLTTPDPPAGG